MELTGLAYPGELSALLAAALWAAASILFDRVGKNIHSVELNLFKGLLALLLLGVTVFISGESFNELNQTAYILIIFSGIVGIGIGDTAFFKTLEYLGARKALLIGTLTPAMTALIALIFLKEALPPAAWVGISITIAGVAWVITEQSASYENERAVDYRGLGYGVLFTFSQAISAVLSRAALTQTSTSPLQSTLLRLGAGVLVLICWILIARIPIGKWLNKGDAKKIFGQAAAATLLGTYLGMWLQQTAFKLSPAGIAQTLSSTSPLFVISILVWAKEKLSLRAVLGAVIAVAGITLLFIS